MRILSCVERRYYGDPVAVNPNFYNFVQVPRRMGHQTLWFDHIEQARLDQQMMNDTFLALVRGGNFDVVFIETGHDEFFPDVLDEAKRIVVTVAFNADDDFRWLDFSSHWYSHYSFMITTYRHIYEFAKPDHPNLLLSQWACNALYDGLSATQDIPFSFVGGIHADRVRRFEELNRQVRLDVYGHGTQTAQATWTNLFRIFVYRLRGGKGNKAVFRNWMLQRLRGVPDSVTYEQANVLWGRTKISFTPLNLNHAQFEKKLAMARAFGKAGGEPGISPWTTPMQIKSRVFEMGLSGTLMLCDRNAMMDEHYERGKEYEDFESLAECVDKVKFYLKDEPARQRLTQAYAARTRRAHLWEHRFRDLFAQIGLKV